MSWFTYTANETEAAKERACMFVAVSLAFQSGTQRYWSGVGTLTISGADYLGLGQLGKVSSTPEHTRLVAEPRTYELSGVDIALVTESDIDSCYGRTVQQWFGFLTDAGALVATPELEWEGTMTSVRRVDGREPTIQVSAEHRLAILDQPDGWRYTHEHQAQFFTGDLGFREMPTIENAEILWGGFRVIPGVSGGGGRAPDGGQYREL